MAASSLTTLLCFAFVTGSLAVTKEDLLPFGPEHGDERLPVGDDESTEEIGLRTPIAFYDKLYSNVYVNINGHLTFQTDLPRYQSNLILPIGIKTIAIFLADIDISLSGNVYYRESSDPSILDVLNALIVQHYPFRKGFRASSVFIVTWDNVGYYSRQYDKTNTFQIVIASDGEDSYCFFYYPEDGINWVKGQGKSPQTGDDVPAQAGFDAGDNQRYKMLPASGNPEIRLIVGWSNVQNRGLFIYRIGNTEQDNIKEPPDDQGSGSTLPESSARTCAEGALVKCFIKASCTDYDQGFCCDCPANHIGNGINCVVTGTNNSIVRATGDVSGDVNGINLDRRLLHIFVILNTAQTYIALDAQESPGNALLALYPLNDVFGWLFADSASGSGSVNGYTMTGGDMNVTIVLRYDAGEQVSISAQSSGLDVNGQIKMQVTVHGTVPNIDPSITRMRTPDVEVPFKRTAPGVITSSHTQSYTIGDEDHTVAIDMTIHYHECAHRPWTHPEMSYVMFIRRDVVYEQQTGLARVAGQSKVANEPGGSDPCDGMGCDVNAECVNGMGRHRCQCKAGFEGNGHQCRDVDECMYGQDDCDDNADCHNTEGSFNCQCHDGFYGDGRFCQRQTGGGDCYNCDDNAHCEYDSETRLEACVCSPGFVGDGQYCERDDNSCELRLNCHRDAHCVTGQDLEPVCQCNEGFTGNGDQCQPASCNEFNNCDVNARCMPDHELRRYVCRCNEGYQGDGYVCESADLTCDQASICDLNADCVTSVAGYICQCRPGFVGDGFTCQSDAELGCDRADICDVNADCVVASDRYVCQCRTGFIGDGRTCRQVQGGGGGDESEYLIYADGESVMTLPFSMTPDVPMTEISFSAAQLAVAVAVDCSEGKVYWTDATGGTISRTSLNGKEQTPEIIVTGLGSPEGLAVDWLSKNIYWADSTSRTIEVSNIDGKHRKVLVNSSLANPRAIVLDLLVVGQMFWSDWNRAAPKIEVANMDGSERRIFVNESLGLPNGLAINSDYQELCWADAGTNKIECMNFQGHGRRTIFAEAQYPFALVFTKDTFYWTDWETHNVPSIGARGSTQNEPLKLLTGMEKPYGLAAVSARCPAGNHQCAYSNGGCPFLCLPTTAGGRICACPDDVDPEECNRISLS